MIKLRVLVSALRWSEVFPLLEALEPKLDLTFPDSPKPQKPTPQTTLKPTTNVQPTSESSTVTPLGTKSLNTPLSSPKQLFVAPSNSPKSELWATLELHVLALGVLAYVQAGQSADASKRIAKLHIILDSGVLDRAGIRDGIVEVCDYIVKCKRYRRRKLPCAFRCLWERLPRAMPPCLYTQRTLVCSSTSLSLLVQ